MTDILIRGMKMPRGCFECPFDRFGDVRDRVTSCWLKTEQGEKCPLVKLPDGHGRCIDADMLYKRVKAECNPYGAPTINYDDGLKVLEMIKNAPTILEAKGGGEE